MSRYSPPSSGGTVADASTTTKGVVQLVDSSTSASTVLAPTANALKLVKDAVTALGSGSGTVVVDSTISSSTVSHIVNVDIPYKARNADAPLVVPTFAEGGQQTTHPSVVYFPNGWHGWKYWMAHTPYPDANASMEDPSIVVSQDGINWVNPSGITNPVFRNPGVGFYSDVDLVYQPHEDKLYLFWRYVAAPNTNERILVSFSGDGISWSPKQETLVTNQWMLSPAIVFDGKQWLMWYVGSDNLSQNVSGANSSVRYRVSDSPFGGWSEQVNTNLIGNCLESDNVGIWHIDVNKYEEEYHMLICSSGSFDLYLATSTDKLTWKVNKKNPILTKAYTPGSEKFDASQLYRATGILEKTSTGYRYKIWYGAVSIANKWRVGYTELDLNGSSMKLNPQKPDEKGLIIEGLPTQIVPLLEIHSHGANQKILVVKYNNVDRFYYEQGNGLRLTEANESIVLGSDDGAKIRFLTNEGSSYLQAGISDSDNNSVLHISRYQSGDNIKTFDVGADLSLFKGDIELNNSAKGAILKSPDGSRWRVQVGNDGVLKTTKL